MMNSDSIFKGPINIGNPVEISINELANMILKLTHSKSIISYKKLPIDDPKRRKPNIELAKSKLDWQPKSDLKAGLLNTINYFKKFIK